MTFKSKVKCTNCSLHYVVLSWEDGWVETNQGGYCPECGIKGAKIAWADPESDEMIFNIVPGGSEMVGMFPAAASTPFAPGDSTAGGAPEAKLLRTLGELRREEAEQS